VFNHEPDGYRCPFCAIVSGVESELNGKADPTHLVRECAIAIRSEYDCDGTSVRPYAERLRLALGAR